MSSGNVPNFLKTLVGPESNFQFEDDPAASAFIKSGYYTTTPHIDVRYLYQDTSKHQNLAGQTAIIEIPKDHDFAGLCEINTPSTALTITGGTFLRRSDWFGFAIIRDIVAKHNITQLQEVLGSQMMPHFLIESTAEHRDNMDPLLLGNFTEPQRDMTATKDIIARTPLDLFVWWSKNSHTYMNTQSFVDQIKLYVRYYDASEWVQTDGDTSTLSANLTTCTIRGQTYSSGLFLQTHHVVEAERVYHHDRQLNVGVLEPFVDYSSVGQQVITVNQTNFVKIEMKNLNMPVRHLIFTVRKRADTTTPYRKNLFKFLKVVGFGMVSQSNGGEFVPFTADRYNRTREHDQYHSSHSDPRFPVYFKSWTFTPEDHINELGSLYFGNLNFAELVLYLGTNIHDSEVRDVLNGNYPGQTAAEECVVDIYVQGFNLRQEFGGTPTKTF